MDCPKCEGELYQVRYSPSSGARISVHRCTDCQGVWFRKDGLNDYLGKGHRAINSEARDPEQAANMDKQEANCPACDIPMMKQASTYDSDILLDACVGCGGTWTDPSELDRLEKAAAEIASSASKFWGSKATG